MSLLTKLIFHSEGNTTLFFVIKNKDDKPLLFYRLHDKGLCGGRGIRHKERSNSNNRRQMAMIKSHGQRRDRNCEVLPDEYSKSITKKTQPRACYYYFDLTILCFTGLFSNRIVKTTKPFVSFNAEHKSPNP